MSRLSRLGFIDPRPAIGPLRRRVRSLGVPPGLEGHEVLYCEDVHEAEQLLSKAFGPLTLGVSDVDSPGFAVSVHGVRLRDVSLLYIDLHVPTTVDITTTGSYYAVLMPTSGRLSWTVNGRDVEADMSHAVVLNPGTHVHVRLAHDLPQLIVRIEQDAVERYLMRLIGRTLTDSLTFEPGFDLTAEAAMRWHGALQMLHTEVLYSGSMVHAGKGISPLEDFLMSSLIMVQPSNHSRLLSASTPHAGRRTVRHALDYMERHLSESITMPDLAAHAGASIRSLQQGFHEEFGVPPMTYLRDRRLERARQELLDAEPADGLTVTDVAAHWGFNHLSGFAGLYRKRYGESPSATLRR